MPQIDYSESGAPIHRHEQPLQDQQPVEEDLLAHLAVGEQLRGHVGRSDFVLRDVLSDVVRVDLHVIRPSEQLPFYSVVTTGMSDIAMKAPQGAGDYRFAELVMALPPNWPFGMLRLERNYWPLRLLKMLARFPHVYQTWLFYMHTVPNGDPAQPYSEYTDMCCALISVPMLYGSAFPQLKINDEKTVHFYSVIPLYREEMEFKLRHGADRLLALLERKQVEELLRPRRRNVCKKRFGIF